MRVYIDCSVPMAVASKADPNRDPARGLLAKVRDGQIEACTSTRALAEIVERYSSMGRQDLAQKVYDLFVALCPEVLPLSLADTDRARDLLLKVPGITPRAAMHAGILHANGIEHIATFDPAFAGLPKIKRWEW